WSIALATPFHLHGFCEVGTEGSKAAIGEDPASAVHAEDGDFSPRTRRPRVAPQYRTRRPFHAYEPAAIPLRTPCDAHYANSRTACGERLTSCAIRKAARAERLAQYATATSIQCELVSNDANCTKADCIRIATHTGTGNVRYRIARHNSKNRVRA